MADPYSTGDVGTFVGTVGDPRVDPLIWFGLKWGTDGAGTSAHLTYSFPKANAAWLSNYADQEPFQNFQPFTAAQQTAAKKALDLWAEVANITFEQITETSTNVGEIRFGNSAAVTNSDFVAWAYGPYDVPGQAWPENGDVWVDRKYPYNFQLNPGQEGFLILLHELGHALGLDHPFADGDPGEVVIDPQYDNDKYTVMSYTAEPTTLAYASTPQMLDILAIQYIYGKNMTTRAGDTMYKFSAAQVNKTIWDAGGIDTLDLSNQRGPVQGTLEGGEYFRFGWSPGGYYSSYLGIAYDVTIENVISGSGHDRIIGNSAANRLVGGGGNDHLAGGEGNDHLEGGAGADLILAEAGDDWADGGAGLDYVNGHEGDDVLFGGAGNDVVAGHEGDDYLDGGAGNDVLAGASGNDTYVIDSIKDSVDEYFNEDSDDIVRSSITVNLANLAEGRIEHATLLGTAAINATGNDKNNALTGNTGANKLDGGVGADTLTGGKGADVYIVNEAGDQIIESIAGAAGGIDTVQSAIDFSLAALANVEKLVLAAGIAGLDGIGNGLNNTLTGNEFANTLDGGIGKDTMAGGAGDDHYIVDNIGDVMTETLTNAKGGGIDTVESSVSYSLAARANVDHLILTGGALNGTGNANNNEISGNANANKLDGGTGNDAVGGNAGDDSLIGGTGNDTLTGGDGADKMTGGAGNDVFDFNLVSELGDPDIITDFKKGLDRIDISDLLDEVLYVGANVFADGFVTFTYDKATTNVWFDKDGSAGGESALSLASLQNVNLTAADSASFIV